MRCCVASASSSASTVKRAVDQPPVPMLELRCDAHRCPGQPRRVLCFLYSIRAGITAASWHVEATFFASADANGTVVLWKKKPAVASHRRRPSFDAIARLSADAGSKM